MEVLEKEPEPRAMMSVTGAPPSLMMARVRPTVSGLRRLAESLRAARTTLLTWPVARICRALDRVSELWLDPLLPERVACISALHHLSGLSPEMVAHAIDLEMKSSRLLDLHRTLRRELHTPEALDGFVADPWLRGRTRAFGPELTGGIFSSNIPALPHLTIMRALLVKSPVLGRSSQDEPLFLPLYLKTLERVAPELAACTAALTWPHDDSELEAGFLKQINHLIAYGGASALNSLAQRIPAQIRTTFHGHKLGISVLMKEALAETVGDDAGLKTLADALAYDFSVFEQQACLAPQVLIIERNCTAHEPEGGVCDATRRVGRALVQALKRLESRLPPRQLSASILAGRRQQLEMLELDGLMGGGVELLTSKERLQGVVTLESWQAQQHEPLNLQTDSAETHPHLEEPRPLIMPCPMERFVRIVEVPSWQVMASELRRRGNLLQNVAVWGTAREKASLLEVLAISGCSRVCLPGQMATPSMMWRHDGIPRLSELVRWCDEELSPPGTS